MLKRSELAPTRIPPAEPLASKWNQLKGTFHVMDFNNPSERLFS